MKKLVCMLLSSVMVLSFAACGSSENGGSTSNNGYVFSYNNVDVTMDQKAEEVTAKLGESKMFEHASCADKGIGKEYTYGGDKFVLGTYQDNGTDLVGYVYVKDASISTKEGVKVGDDVDAVKKAYPDATDDAGLYQCKKGNMTIKFVMDADNKVEEIDYCSNATKL